MVLDLVLPVVLGVVTIALILLGRHLALEPGPISVAVMFMAPVVIAYTFADRPVRFGLGLAAMAWFVAWKAGKLTFPTIVHAAAFTTCVPHTVSAWVNEGGGNFVVHKIVTAVCTTIQTTTSSALQ